MHSLYIVERNLDSQFKPAEYRSSRPINRYQLHNNHVSTQTINYTYQSNTLRFIVFSMYYNVHLLQHIRILLLRINHTTPSGRESRSTDIKITLIDQAPHSGNQPVLTACHLITNKYVAYILLQRLYGAIHNIRLDNSDAYKNTHTIAATLHRY